MGVEFFSYWEKQRREWCFTTRLGLSHQALGFPCGSASEHGGKKVVRWTPQVLPSSSLAALQRWDSPYSTDRSELDPRVLKTQATPPQAVCPPAIFSFLSSFSSYSQHRLLFLLIAFWTFQMCAFHLLNLIVSLFRTGTVLLCSSSVFSKEILDFFDRQKNTLLTIRQLDVLGLKTFH